MLTEQQAQVAKALSAAAYDDIAIVTINGVTYERIGEPVIGTLGFRASLYKSVANPGEVVVAPVGTEKGNFVDVFADTNLGTQQYEDNRPALLAAIAAYALSDGITDLMFAGHSLGGGLAQYGAYDFVGSQEGNSLYENVTVTLADFNAFGGETGMQQLVLERPDETYDPNRLGDIDAGHFFVTGDVVSLFGEAHLGGVVYQNDLILPDGFTPLVAHSMETSYNAPENSGVVLTDGAIVIPDYLDVAVGQAFLSAFANVANLFSPGTVTNTEAMIGVLLGVGAVATFAPTDELDSLGDAIFPDLAFVNWGELREFAIPGVIDPNDVVEATIAAAKVAEALGEVVSQAVQAQTVWTIEQVLSAAQGIQDMVDVGKQVLDYTQELVEQGVVAAEAARDVAFQTSLRLALEGAKSIQKLVETFESAVDYTVAKVDQFEQFLDSVADFLVDEVQETATSIENNFNATVFNTSNVIENIANTYSDLINQNINDAKLFISEKFDDFQQDLRFYQGAFGNTNIVPDGGILVIGGEPTLFTTDINGSIESQIAGINVDSPNMSLLEIADVFGIQVNDLLELNPQFNNSSDIVPQGELLFYHDPAGPGNATGTLNNDFLQINVDTLLTPSDPGATDLNDQAAAVENNILINEATHTVQSTSSVVNGSSLVDTLMGGQITGGNRPANGNLLTYGWQTTAEVAATSHSQNTGFFAGVQYNTAQSGSVTNTFVDPLILDLNGDGVQLLDANNAQVLFDIDHDGVTEQTGWISAEDGILVVDLNSDGIINSSKEMISEYYNGVEGVGGSAGSIPFANGFAALASLDSNTDNIFDNQDTAWSSVQVWIDANSDGITDAGELHTLDSLGVISIDLNSDNQSGEILAGNEVLARSTFTINPGTGNETREALAVNFIANPDGHDIITDIDGTTINTQSGISSFVSNDDTGVTLDVAVKGVQSLYGAAGDDTLIGDANDNWLGGGLGSDTYNAGAGNDVLLIDADDLQANIHAGDGIDYVKVVGDQGVVFNLALAEVEIAHGGRGNDILIGGGRSNVFIQGGAGDDIIIGGDANDALSGEDGSDLIDGGAGNDIIRGHKGRDRLIGGVGDDIMEGGEDDDTLFGGVGNDIIKGGRGDDFINGGDGIDIAQFNGSFADYRITRTEAGIYVSDTVSGRDGTDFLTEIEKFSFRDLAAVDINLANPVPVKDILEVPFALGDSTPYLIAAADLLANDIDYQGDTLSITELTNVQGGSAVLQGGDVLFTPDADFTGVPGFQYKIQDSQGNVGASFFIIGTGANAETKGSVYLRTTDMPSDPLLTDQWYLSEANILPVWQDYTGKGVKIAQFEPGGAFSVTREIFDYRHADLAPNVDQDWLADSVNTVEVAFSTHATLVAGVIVADDNGEGGIGVAHDATLAGFYIANDGSDLGALARYKDFDVVNNSWAIVQNFAGNFQPETPLVQAFEDAVDNGRGGLGTVMVFAGGNDRQGGGNTNYQNISNNRTIITVGAINAQEDLGALVIGQDPFSNPGASILISAPGSNIASTSRLLTDDNGSVFGSDFEVTQGTSFATPIVTGIVALMLEANPDLGYRDVQQILALSARSVNDPNTDWVDNGATNWNGGGMHTSHDYGFGNVDALAAVRLAESWIKQSIHVANANLPNAQVEVFTEDHLQNLNEAIPDNGTLIKTFTLAAGISIEHATLVLNFQHDRVGDLIIKLISPDGTESLLANRPGKAPGSDASDLGDLNAIDINFEFNSTNHWGEDSGGVWTLEITDAAGGQTGILRDARLRVHGEVNTDNDTYYYTNEFATLGTGARAQLTDSGVGSDVINAAAVSSDSTINLNDGANSTIAGQTITITSGSNIEHAIAGDGNDILIGNALANELRGNRGDDILDGGAGLDFIDGGSGNDNLTGGQGFDHFIIRKDAGSEDTITDLGLSGDPDLPDKIALVGFDNIEDFSQIITTQDGSDVRADLGDGQSILIKNRTLSQITEQAFIFLANEDVFKQYTTQLLTAFNSAGILFGDDTVQNGNLPTSTGNSFGYFAMGGDDIIIANTVNDLIDAGDGDDQIQGDASSGIDAGNDWLEGGAGNDLLLGREVDDYISGGSGNDTLSGWSGNDTIYGGSGSDILFGDDPSILDTTLHGDDTLYGGSGIDILVGHAGDDVLIGGADNDYVDGGAGNDTIYVEGDSGTVEIGGANNGTYTLVKGGADADTFVITSDALNKGSVWSLGGNLFSANNLIFDFDVNQAGEVIDLSQVSWIKSFSDLTINQTLTGITEVVNITASNASDSISIMLWDTIAGDIGADDFIFAAPDPYGKITDGNDVLTGDAGGNILDGGLGADDMTGRTGDDTYIVDDIGDTVNELPGGGFDTVKSSVTYTLDPEVENLTLTGTVNIDATGNQHVNRIVGNSGNNVLDGGAGIDTLVGHEGDDTYIVDNTTDAVIEQAGEGTDTVQSSVSYGLGNHIENLTLTGTDAVNATGNSLDNTLIGNTNSNVLIGGAGADTMAGGAGNDTYLVDQTGDVVTELLNEGIDTVIAGIDYTLGSNLENLTLSGSAGLTGTGNELDNRLVGNQAANTLSGLDGDDVLDGGSGADTLIGGLGNDTFVVDDAGDVVTENVGEGTDTVRSSIAYILGATLENLTLLGTNAINAVGNSLSNILKGNVADNTLTGNAGDDLFDGGAGADTMIGGVGDDTYIVDNIGDVVTELAGEGTDTVNSSITYTLADKPNVENLKLTGFDAIDATGNASANTIKGNSNNNIIDGGVGNDSLEGGFGSDTYLLGIGSGQDTITEVSRFSGEIDTVLVAGGLTPADISINRNASDITITIDSTGDELIVLTSPDGEDGIERILFNDGTEWNAPTLDNFITNQHTANGAVFSFTVPTNTFSDMDVGDSLTYSATLADASSLSGWLSFDALTQTFTGNPDDVDIGISDIRITATDSTGLSATDTFLITVNDINNGSLFELSSLFTVNGGDGSAGFVLNGIDTLDESGWRVSSAGDVNGDGFDDLVIGAITANTNGHYSGETYVVYGQAGGFAAEFELSSLLAANGGDGSSGFVLYGIDASDFSGRDIDSGDLNGDGFSDLIISAVSADPNGSASGESYVIYGKASNFAPEIQLSSLLPSNGGDGSVGFILNGIDAGDVSGQTVAFAGDINGDGLNDLIISGSRADPNGDSSGESYVVYGQTGNFSAEFELSSLLAVNGGDGSVGTVFKGVGANDYSGSSVASAGDINGDGLDDLIIGAWFADPNGSSSGQSYVVYGKTLGFSAEFELSSLLSANGGDGSAGFALNGLSAGGYSGAFASSAGDINGDGFDDIIISATYASPNGSASGQSYVVYGQAGAFSAEFELSSLLSINGGDGSAGFVINGIVANDLSGYSVASAGDINGDGINDLLIGRGFSYSDAGSSYVIFGRNGNFGAEFELSSLLPANGGDGSNGFILNGVDISDASGQSISSAGDINGDGFDDLIIGAYWSSPNGKSYAGESYVVYGRDFRNEIEFVGTAANDVLLGTAANEQLIAGLGDDVLDGGLGNDVLKGGGGNDTLIFDSNDTLLVDGGSGVDTLSFTGSNKSLDLTAAANGLYQDIEIIDLTGSGSFNTLTIDSTSLFNLSTSTNTLRVDGHMTDAVIASGVWVSNGIVNIGGVDYNEYQEGEAILQIQTGVDDNGVNQAPTVANAITNQSTDEDAVFGFVVPANTFDDVNVGDTLTYSASLDDDSALPGWLSFDALTQTFSGTPLNDDVGDINVKVTANDGTVSVSDTFTLTVNNTNDTPTVINAITDRGTDEDAAFSFTVPVNTFGDIDIGDTLTYSATLSDDSALPSWLSFDALTQTFNGTPLNGDVGDINVKVTANDGTVSVSDTFTLTVNNTNNTPTVVNAIIDKNTDEHAAFSFTVPANTFDDVDVGDTLTYTATLGDDSVLPSWLSFDALTQTFSGTPTNVDLGTIGVKVTATDSSGLSDSDTFMVTVVGEAPSLDTSHTLNYDAASESSPSDGIWEDTTAVSGFNFNLSNETINTNPATAFTGIMQTYHFVGMGGGKMRDLQGLSGNPTNNSASFELWFRPDDLTDADVLFETGGGGDGTSFIVVDEDMDGEYDDLQFVVKDSGTILTLTADLSIILGSSSNVTSEFIQVVGTYDRNIFGGSSDEIKLYINGALADQASSTTLNDWAGGNNTGLGRVNGNINVGKNNVTNFEGDIGLFRFYESTLTNSVVNNNFNFIAGADQLLIGTSGDDILIGSYNNDVIIGGAGNDRLEGLGGDDNYLYSRGDALDTISDTGGSADEINFGGDINHGELWFWQKGDDLRVGALNTLDWLTIEDWYTDPNKKIEIFNTTDDNFALVESNVQQLVAAMAVFSVPSSGSLDVPQAIQDDVQSVIATAWQAT